MFHAILGVEEQREEQRKVGLEVGGVGEGGRVGDTVVLHCPFNAL